MRCGTDEIIWRLSRALVDARSSRREEGPAAAALSRERLLGGAMPPQLLGTGRGDLAGLCRRRWRGQGEAAWRAFVTAAYAADDKESADGEEAVDREEGRC
jgi:hypothetical protein